MILRNICNILFFPDKSEHKTTANLKPHTCGHGLQAANMKKAGSGREIPEFQKLKYIKGLPAEIDAKYTLTQNITRRRAMTRGFLRFHTSRL